MTSSVVPSVLVFCVTWPTGKSGKTGPNPTPLRTIVSPGRAGREGKPANSPVSTAPGGRTRPEPSLKKAPTYCLPPSFSPAGAQKPGDAWSTLTTNPLLEPVAVLTANCCAPVATPEGTSAFTWVGLT